LFPTPSVGIDCRLPDEVPARFDRQSLLGNQQSSRGGVVFWALILMGLCTFAPCVLLPEWRDYQAARGAEQRAQHRLDHLQGTVDHEKRGVEAMQNDPAVVARIAQRDLGFRRPDATTVSVEVPHVPPEESDAVFIPEPVTPPVWLGRVLGFLPDFDYDAVFCHERTRSIVMVMSVGLIVMAIALFSGKRCEIRDSVSGR